MTALQSVVRRMHDDGHPVSAIAIHVGRPKQYVWTALRRMGVTWQREPPQSPGREIPDGARCPRCQLLEPHQCVSHGAYALARSEEASL